MGIKGTSVIELTDVKTGQVQTFENSNIVTAAVPKVLGLHVGLLERHYSVANEASTILPPVPNAIGGILCYEDALEENPEMLYAPSENKLVGCASNDSHSTTSTLRGSMNAVESGPLDDGKGYKFVFDFATSQGNGTIAALALTSKFGGISGFGDAASPFTCVRNLGNSYVTTSSTAYEQYTKVITALMNAVHVRCDQNDLIAIVPMATGELQIWSIPFPTTKVDLSGGAWYDQSSYRVLATIQPSVNFFNGISGQTQTSAFYGSFFDGGDGYWWGFSNRYNYSVGTNTVYWLKISQETYEFEEGTWTLNNVSLYESRIVAFSDTLNTTYWYDNAYLRSDCHVTCGNGHLYMLNYARNQVYKINMSNPTDMTTIDIETVAEKSSYNEYRPYHYIRYIHGRVYTPTGFIDENNTFVKAAMSWNDGMMLPVTNSDQVFAFCFGRYNTQTYACVKLITPYLATINNLEKPVLKTADKTMKITYILREE